MSHINRMAGLPEFMVGRWDVARLHGVDLKDCPFCGGVPALYASPSPHVVCTACAAEGPTFEARRETRDECQNKALLAWNVRT